VCSVAGRARRHCLIGFCLASPGYAEARRLEAKVGVVRC
jgi:hypothetical protein